MKIKICGIKNTDEAKIMNEAMPDFVGFIFAKSKRQITPKIGLEIKKILNPKIKTVGVFVDLSAEEIIKYKGIIEIAQLHGNYSEKDIEFLKKGGLEIIKVIRVDKNEYNITTSADYLLFDTYQKDQFGGTNKTFNWDIKIETKTPFFIAGGLNEFNLKEMAKKLNPYGADVSSGAEIDGFKTKEKVSNIIKVIKEINL